MGGTSSVEKVEKVIIEPDSLPTYEVKDAPFFRTEVDAEAPIRVAKTGVGANAPTNVINLFKKAKETCGEHIAMKVETKPDEWKEWTFNQYYEDVMCAARGFVSLGVKPFESVNIIGFNSPQWFISLISAMAINAKAAGIYTTNNSAACRYITEHSEARVVVLENKQQLDKFLPWRDECKNLSAIIMWSGELPEGINANTNVPVMTWDEFMKLGENPETKDTLSAEVERRIGAIRPGHCCSLIYTSGTTGNPKAVMLSHDNCSWTPEAFLYLFPAVPEEAVERVVSYLPLSHVAAQVLDIYTPIALAAHGRPTTIIFARPDALKGTLKLTLAAARPTVFFGVPRVWEKMMEGMQARASSATGIKRVITNWALGRGSQKFESEQVSGDGSVPFGFGLADSMVFSKVHAALGFDRCRLFLTGAAPIAKDVLRFFGQFDIAICEVYGMSETTGPQNCCRFNYKQIGSCGVPIPGTELKIHHVPGRDKEGEGEICFRGRHIMMGYMKEPHKTHETIDDEGFLHSGDVGHVDENGLLFITGRIKELLITAGGENIAPVPIEDQIKSELPGVSNVMLIGDRRKFNSCLVTFRQQLDEKTGEFTDDLAGASLDVSENSKTVAQAMQDPVWKKYVEDGIARANKVAVSNAQKVQKFVFIPRDFSVSTGELTATLKLRRAVVSEMYSAQIEEMYAGSNE